MQKRWRTTQGGALPRTILQKLPCRKLGNGWQGAPSSISIGFALQTQTYMLIEKCVRPTFIDEWFTRWSNASVVVGWTLPHPQHIWAGHTPMQTGAPTEFYAQAEFTVGYGQFKFTLKAWRAGFCTMLSHPTPLITPEQRVLPTTISCRQQKALTKTKPRKMHWSYRLCPSISAVLTQATYYLGGLAFTDKAILFEAGFLLGHPSCASASCSFQLHTIYFVLYGQEDRLSSLLFSSLSCRLHTNTNSSKGAGRPQAIQ